MSYVHLTAEQVPATLAGDYRGKKFKAKICTTVEIPADAGTWHGGARDVFYAIRLSDGRGVPLTDTMSAPWDSSRSYRNIALQPGIVVVCHSQFNGKDMGLTFHMLASDAAPLLPAPAAEMNPEWLIVLEITRGIKSSYRQDEARRKGITLDNWKAATIGLQALGYLDTRGAITPAGRNAAPARGY